MKGTVLFWEPARCVGGVLDDAGRKHYALLPQIAENEVGAKFLVKDEPVEFELGHDPKGRPCAVNVRPIWRDPVDTENYAGEICEVLWSNPRFASRPLGGTVFINNNFSAGQMVLVTKFAPPIRPGQSWVALDPLLVAENFQEYEARECV